MAIKFHFPNWVDVKREHIDSVDAGSYLLPVKKSEWSTYGLFLRGPVVIEATPRTPDKYASQFPATYTFVRLDPASNYSELHADIGERPVIFQLQRVLYSTDNAIYFTAKTVGHLKIRRIQKEDYDENIDVDQYVKEFWGR